MRQPPRMGGGRITGKSAGSAPFRPSLASLTPILRVPPRRIFASHRQQLPYPVVGRAGTACRGSGTIAVVLGRDLLALPPRSHPPECLCLACRPQARHPLVHHRREALIPRSDLPYTDLVDEHSAPSASRLVSIGFPYATRSIIAGRRLSHCPDDVAHRNNACPSIAHTALPLLGCCR